MASSLRSCISVVLVFALLVLGRNEAAPTSSSTVVKLNGENFDSVVGDSQSEKTVVVAFLSSSCLVCKQMHPMYEEAASYLKSKNIDKVLLTEVNCDESRDICAKYNITSYPTAKGFVNGNKDAPQDYQVKDASKYLEMAKSA